MKTKLLIAFLTISLVSYSQFWTEASTGFADASRGLNQMSIANNNVIWATAYDGSGAGANVQEITKSIDGGLTWVASDINLGGGTGGLGIANIFALDENTAWIAAFPNTAFDRGGIWKTTDGGTVWTKQTSALYSASSAFTNIVYFWDANNGFCQGDPVGPSLEMYTTTDGGDTWVRVPSAGIPPHQSGEYGYVRQIEVVGDRLWFTTNKGRIYRSDDHGLTFSVFQSPISDFGSATSSGNISFWNSNDGLLASAQGGLWSTNDGGATWNMLTSPENRFFDVECVAGTTSAVLVGNDGANPAVSSSYYSNDSGATWTLADNTQRIELEFNNSIGFASGFTTDPTTGGIFRYTGTELMNFGTAAIIDNTLNTFKAYPNPFENILTIEAKDIISNVEIFNILGQSIFKTEINKNILDIDMSNFNSGTYVLKVTINETIQTMKLVK